MTSESVFDTPLHSHPPANLASPAGSIHLPVTAFSAELAKEQQRTQRASPAPLPSLTKRAQPTCTAVTATGNHVPQSNIRQRPAQTVVLGSLPMRPAGQGYHMTAPNSQAASIANAMLREFPTSTQDAEEDPAAQSDDDTIEMGAAPAMQRLSTGTAPVCSGGGSAGIHVPSDPRGAAPALRRAASRAGCASVSPPPFERCTGAHSSAAVAAPVHRVPATAAGSNGMLASPTLHVASGMAPVAERERRANGATASPAASAAAGIENAMWNDGLNRAAPAAVSASGVDFGAEGSLRFCSQEGRGAEFQWPQATRVCSGEMQQQHDAEPQPAACTVPLQPPDRQQPSRERGGSMSSGGMERRSRGAVRQDPEDGQRRSVSVGKGQSDGEVQKSFVATCRASRRGYRRGAGAVDAEAADCGGRRADSIICDGTADAVAAQGVGVGMVVERATVPTGAVEAMNGHKGNEVQADAIIRVGGDDGEEEVQAKPSRHPLQDRVEGLFDEYGVPGMLHGEPIPADDRTRKAAVSGTANPHSRQMLRSCNGSVCGAEAPDLEELLGGVVTWRHEPSQHGRRGSVGSGPTLWEPTLVGDPAGLRGASESGSQNALRAAMCDDASEAFQGSARHGIAGGEASGVEERDDMGGEVGSRGQEGVGEAATRNARAISAEGEGEAAGPDPCRSHVGDGHGLARELLYNSSITSEHVRNTGAATAAMPEEGAGEFLGGLPEEGVEGLGEVRPGEGQELDGNVALEGRGEVELPNVVSRAADGLEGCVSSEPVHHCSERSGSGVVMSPRHRTGGTRGGRGKVHSRVGSVDVPSGTHMLPVPATASGSSPNNSYHPQASYSNPKAIGILPPAPTSAHMLHVQEGGAVATAATALHARSIHESVELTSAAVASGTTTPLLQLSPATHEYVQATTPAPFPGLLPYAPSSTGSAYGGGHAAAVLARQLSLEPLTSSAQPAAVSPLGGPRPSSAPALHHHSGMMPCCAVPFPGTQLMQDPVSGFAVPGSTGMMCLPGVGTPSVNLPGNLPAGSISWLQHLSLTDPMARELLLSLSGSIMPPPVVTQNHHFSDLPHPAPPVSPGLLSLNSAPALSVVPVNSLQPFPVSPALPPPHNVQPVTQFLDTGTRQAAARAQVESSAPHGEPMPSTSPAPATACVASPATRRRSRRHLCTGGHADAPESSSGCSLKRIRTAPHTFPLPDPQSCPPEAVTRAGGVPPLWRAHGTCATGGFAPPVPSPPSLPALFPEPVTSHAPNGVIPSSTQPTPPTSPNPSDMPPLTREQRAFVADRVQLLMARMGVDTHKAQEALTAMLSRPQ